MVSRSEEDSVAVRAFVSRAAGVTVQWGRLFPTRTAGVCVCAEAQGVMACWGEQLGSLACAR